MGPDKWVSIRPDFWGLKWVSLTHHFFVSLNLKKASIKSLIFFQGPNSLSIRPHFNFPLN